MQSTNNNLPNRLAVIYANYSEFVKQGLKRGLFTETIQVLAVHTDLEELKKIINEQSKQQSGVNNLDSGAEPATIGANSKTVQKKTRQRKKAAETGPEPGPGANEPGPGAEQPAGPGIREQEFPFDK